MLNFGQKLKSLRHAKQMNQSDLGAAVGISASAVGMYEQGRWEPDRRTLLKICRFFDVTETYFQEGEPLEKSAVQYTDLDVLLGDLKEFLARQEVFYANGRRLSKEECTRLGEAFEIAAAVCLKTTK